MSSRELSTTVLVTGGGGYLGSVLVPLLVARGYNVRVLDRFFFGKEILTSCTEHKSCVLIAGDTRWCSENVLRDVDVVIDLAALANDQLGEINPQRTLDINFGARVRIAKLAKEMGAKQYILASSCSVYGFQDGLIDETSPTKPLTTYATANVLAEQGVLSLKERNFSVTVLRQGTLYGLSPRMRFDLVLNTMVLSMFRDRTINIHGGDQWRPLLQVEDSARAFIKVMESSQEEINGEIFNVGSTEQNFQIKKLAKLLADILPDCINIIWHRTSDSRSYRVSCGKIERKLGYELTKTPASEAPPIYAALTSGLVADALKTRTVDWYRELLARDPLILDEVVGDVWDCRRSGESLMERSA